MVTRHPEVDAEIDLVLQRGGTPFEICLGQMVRRHARIARGCEPFSPAERGPLGPSGRRLCRVEQIYGQDPGGVAVVLCVYAASEAQATDAVLLAVDAFYAGRRIFPDPGQSDAMARAWGRD